LALRALVLRTRMTVANAEKETDMSVKGEIKEGAGFIKEPRQVCRKSAQGAGRSRLAQPRQGRRRQGAEDDQARNGPPREVDEGSPPPIQTGAEIYLHPLKHERIIVSSLPTFRRSRRLA
jgi:hypothetical protein